MVSGALITLFGYYNPLILVETAMLAAGAGLISTFWLDTPFSKWFGYQVLLGLGTGVCFQVSNICADAFLFPASWFRSVLLVGHLASRLLISIIRIGWCHCGTKCASTGPRSPRHRVRSILSESRRGFVHCRCSDGIPERANRGSDEGCTTTRSIDIYKLWCFPD